MLCAGGCLAVTRSAVFCIGNLQAAVAARLIASARGISTVAETPRRRSRGPIPATRRGSARRQRGLLGRPPKSPPGGLRGRDRVIATAPLWRRQRAWPLWRPHDPPDVSLCATCSSSPCRVRAPGHLDYCRRRQMFALIQPRRQAGRWPVRAPAQAKQAKSVYGCQRREEERLVWGRTSSGVNPQLGAA